MQKPTVGPGSVPLPPRIQIDDARTVEPFFEVPAGGNPRDQTDAINGALYWRSGLGAGRRYDTGFGEVYASRDRTYLQLLRPVVSPEDGRCRADDPPEWSKEQYASEVRRTVTKVKVTPSRTLRDGTVVPACSEPLDWTPGDISAAYTDALHGFPVLETVYRLPFHDFGSRHAALGEGWVLPSKHAPHGRYDADTGIRLLWSERSIPEFDQDPAHRAAVVAGLTALPFASVEARDNYLSLFIGLHIIGAGNKPAGVMDAPGPGSVKTYAGEAVGEYGTGGVADLFCLSESPSERVHDFRIFMSAPVMVPILDECSDLIGSALFESAMTAEGDVQSRITGKGLSTAKGGNRRGKQYILTGIHMRLRPASARRATRVALLPSASRPEVMVKDYIRKNRAFISGVMMGALDEWERWLAIHPNTPRPMGPRLASFERVTETIGGVLAVLLGQSGTAYNPGAGGWPDHDDTAPGATKFSQHRATVMEIIRGSEHGMAPLEKILRRCHLSHKECMDVLDTQFKAGLLDTVSETVGTKTRTVYFLVPDEDAETLFDGRRLGPVAANAGSRFDELFAFCVLWADQFRDRRITGSELLFLLPQFPLLAVEARNKSGVLGAREIGVWLAKEAQQFTSPIEQHGTAGNHTYSVRA